MREFLLSREFTKKVIVGPQGGDVEMDSDMLCEEQW